MDLTGLDAQRNVVVGHDARVSLSNASEHEPRFRIGCNPKIVHVFQSASATPSSPWRERRPPQSSVKKQSARQVGNYMPDPPADRGTADSNWDFCNCVSVMRIW